MLPIGDDIADVSEAAGGIHGDDPRIRAAGWHRVFGTQLACLGIDGIGGNAVGKP